MANRLFKYNRISAEVYIDLLAAMYGENAPSIKAEMQRGNSAEKQSYTPALDSYSRNLARWH